MNPIKMFIAIMCLTVQLNLVAGVLAVVDQENLNHTGSAGLSPNSGQTFTATLNAIDAVEYQLKSNDLVMVSVNLRENNGSGALLGTSNQLTLNNNNLFDVYHFDFQSQVAINPGDVYFLQIIQHNAGSMNIAFDSTNTYAAGSYLSSGVSPFFDVWFRAGMHAVPEPSSWAMIFLGVLGLYFYRRKTS